MTKYLNSHKIIELYKEILYLRAGLLSIDILQRVPMILSTFMEIFISVLYIAFQSIKHRKLNI